MKGVLTSKEFYIGFAAAIAAWYAMNYFRARKAASTS